MRKRWRLTYYDFNHVSYSSYFLSGFLQNEIPFQYCFRVSRKLPALLHEADPTAEFASILFSVLLFRAERDGREINFCIDARDSAWTTRGTGYHLPLLRAVDLYFKVNYNQRAIAEDVTLREHAHKIHSVGPFFPVSPGRLMMFRPRLRPCKEAGWTLHSTLSRFLSLKGLPQLDELIGLRAAEKDLDLFFVTTLYEEKHSADNEFRLRVMQEIRRRKLKAVTGFTSRGDLPRPYDGYGIERLGLRDYLQCLARARVGLYVRGVHQCLSFKLGQFFALGLPIAGQKLTSNPTVITLCPQLTAQFAYEEPTELLDRAEELISEPATLEELGRNNAGVFDRYLTPQAVTADILNRVLA